MFFSKFIPTLFCETPENPEFYHEKNTGLYLPTRIELRNKYNLLSAAARKVTIFRFSAYAIGIYEEEDKEVTTTQEYVSCSEAVAKKSLLLRISPSRTTKSSHIKCGLSRILNMQLDASSTDKLTLEACQKSIGDLNASIPNGYINRGEVILFEKHLSKPEVLTVYFQGMKQTEIRSGWLSSALFEAYLCSPDSTVPKVLIMAFIIHS